jgi:hypothetical protein
MPAHKGLVCPSGCGKVLKSAKGVSSHLSQVPYCGYISQATAYRLLTERVGRVKRSSDGSGEESGAESVSASMSPSDGRPLTSDNGRSNDNRDMHYQNEDGYGSTGSREDPIHVLDNEEPEQFEHTGSLQDLDHFNAEFNSQSGSENTGARSSDMEQGNADQGYLDLEEAQDSNQIGDDHFLVGEQNEAPPKLQEYRKNFPRPAGTIIGHGPSKFREVYKELQEMGDNNIYYPFANEMDWDLGAFLVEDGMPMADIDTFLKLSYVRASHLR